MPDALNREQLTQEQVKGLLEGATPDLTITTETDGDTDIDYPYQSYEWIQWVNLSSGAVLSVEDGALSEGDAALLMAAPSLGHSLLAALARAEAAEARVRELELAEVTVASELTAIHEEMRAVLMWSTTLHNDEAQRIRRWQVTLRKTLGLKTGMTPRLPCGTDVIYKGRKGEGPGRIMNHEWNDAATETIGYLIARPGDEEYPDCWESVGLSAVTALAGGQ